MEDRVEFSIPGVKSQVENLRESNSLNKRNKEAFLDYIDSKLAPEWNTKEGKVAVGELRNFVNTKFQDYITYLDEKIDSLEYVVIPALERINNA